MKRTINGFTIVELLIVIVVIGILAAITVVAYTGIQERARYTKMQNDMATIQKVLQLYYVDNGVYPDSSACANTPGEYNYQYQWCGWNQGQADSFIPGVVPEYVTALPTLDRSLPSEDTYLYQSRDATGNDTDTATYELIRFRRAGLSQTELSSVSSDHLLTGSGYTGIAWGFKSDPSLSWW